MSDDAATLAQRAIEYALTCRRENTDEWMEGFAEYVNAWAAAMPDESDRVAYDKRRGAFRIVKQGDA